MLVVAFFLSLFVQASAAPSQFSQGVSSIQQTVQRNLGFEEQVVRMTRSRDLQTDTCFCGFFDNQYTGGCSGGLVRRDESKWCTSEGIDICCAETEGDCCELTGAGNFVFVVVIFLIVASIVFCSCACCKCCPFYDKLCCADGGCCCGGSPSQPINVASPQPAVPGVQMATIQPQQSAQSDPYAAKMVGSN